MTKLVHSMQEETLSAVSNSSKITIVIPAYKASRTILQVIEQCAHYADNIVVVDDACPESTGKVAERSTVNVQVVQ